MTRIELPRPIAQPEFPLRDLVPENMKHVSDRLGNPAVEQLYRDASDIDLTVCRQSHPRIEQYARTSKSELSPVEVVSHGMLLLEVMAAAVTGRRDIHMVDGATAELALSGIGARNSNMVDGAQESIAEFKRVLPNATEIVVEETEKRLGRGLAEYAILGATLERRVLVGSINRIG